MVKQCCILSPNLFSIYLNDLANDIKNLNCEIYIYTINTCTYIDFTIYADYIVLTAESEDKLQRMLTVLNERCKEWRNCLNESETKIVHFRK